MKYADRIWNSPVFRTVFSGVAAGFSFPQHGFSGLAFFALIPLFTAVGEVGRLPRAAFLGWIWGISFFAVLLPWIPAVMMNFGHQDPWTSGLVFILLLAVLGLYYALFAWIYAFFCRGLGPDRSLFLVPALWTGIEWLRTYFPMGGFPWGQLGYALTPCLAYMQSAALVGIYGPTFLAVLVNALVTGRLSWGRLGRGIRFGWTAMAVLLAASWCYGLIVLHRRTLPASGQPPLPVAVLQGNIAFDNDLSAARDAFQGFYLTQTRQAFRDGALLVVRPESPTPFSFYDHEEYRLQLQSLAAEGKGFLLFNDIVTRGDGDSSRYFNGALLMGPDGKVRSEYHKTRLVPFGEYVPYAEYFGFAEALTREVGAFTAGTLSGAMPLPSCRIGVFICFETIFPDLVRRLSREDAGLLVNISNDAWYGRTSAPWQHLQMAVVRAIENRRPLLRAANSGISAWITPFGEIREPSPLFEQRRIQASIPLERERSLYLRIGDGFPLLCVMIVAAGMAWTGFRHGRQSGKRTGNDRKG